MYMKGYSVFNDKQGFGLLPYTLLGYRRILKTKNVQLKCTISYTNKRETRTFAKRILQWEFWEGLLITTGMRSWFVLPQQRDSTKSPSYVFTSPSVASLALSNNIEKHGWKTYVQLDPNGNLLATYAQWHSEGCERLSRVHPKQAVREATKPPTTILGKSLIWSFSQWELWDHLRRL